MRIPNLRPFLAFSFIGTVCLMPLLVLPAMIGVLVDYAGMSDSSAGWSSSAHFFAAAAVGLLLSVRMHHINLRQITTWALALAVIADSASAFTAGESALFFSARIIAGVMLGASYICSVAAFARYEGYERGFGLFVTLQFIVSGLGLYLVPVYADQIGAGGLFAGLAVLDVVALLLARFLPSAKADHLGAHPPQSEIKTLLTMTAILAVLGFAIFEAANNAQFAYIERFGVALDIPPEKIGFSLLIASLIGIPGAFAVVVIGQRFGTLGPLLFGIAIAIAGLITLINAETYNTYFIGSCCMGFSWAYCLPFIQSLLASIDRNGSAIAAGSSLSTFGSALGPGIAAVVVTGGRYENVFLLSMGLFAATVAAFVYADRAIKESV